MTILLTGATGFIGQWVAKLLKPSPHNLRVLVRSGSSLSDLDGLPVEIVRGDLLDRASLRRALDGVRQVYHVAGVISFQPHDADLVRQVNYEGAVNFFEAALESGVERVVYTASIFALGAADDDRHLATEESRFNATNLLDIPYLQAKRDAELAAARAIERGLPLVRLYPGLCLGPGDHKRSSSATIDHWLRGRLPAVITGGGICLMDVRDAAAAHIAAMQYGLPGHQYLATGYNVTLPDLFNHLEAITGLKPPVQLPAWLGVPAIRLVENLGFRLPFEAAQARLMSRYWWYDSSRAQRELGIRFRPLDETLADTVSWLREQPPRS